MNIFHENNSFKSLLNYTIKISTQRLENIFNLYLYKIAIDIFWHFWIVKIKFQKLENKLLNVQTEKLQKNWGKKEKKKNHQVKRASKKKHIYETNIYQTISNIIRLKRKDFFNVPVNIRKKSPFKFIILLSH